MSAYAQEAFRRGRDTDDLDPVEPGTLEFTIRDAFRVAFEAGECSGARKARKAEFILCPTWPSAYKQYRRLVDAQRLDGVAAGTHWYQHGYHGNVPLSEAGGSAQSASAKDYPINFSRCCE